MHVVADRAKSLNQLGVIRSAQPMASSAVAPHLAGFLLRSLLGIRHAAAPDHMRAASFFILQIPAGPYAQRTQRKSKMVGLAAATGKSKVASTYKIGDLHAINPIYIAFRRIAHLKVVID